MLMTEKELKSELENFKENDFHALKCQVEKLGKAVSFIKGQLFVIIPLLIGILWLQIR